MRKLFLALAIAVLALIPLGAAAESPQGVISGQMVNKTPGGGSVAEEKLTLIVSVSGEEKERKETTTDKEGKFSFSSLETSPDYSYQLNITYQGAEYNGDPITFASGETEKVIELTVWDATDSDASLHLGSLHIIIEAGQGVLKVWEYQVLVNQGDKTYAGSSTLPGDTRKATWLFSLPQGFHDLQYGEGLMECCVVPGSQGMVDTMAVFPGSKEAIFSYVLDTSSSSFIFSRKLDYPVGGVDFLVKNPGGLGVASDQLTDNGPVTADGASYLYYSATALPKGSVLSATITGLPRPSITGSLKWLALAAGVVAVAAIVVGFPKMRGKRKAGEKERLLQELAELDERFEAGEIAADDYYRLRGEKKARLTRLWGKG